jgi:hypothetical protein
MQYGGENYIGEWQSPQVTQRSPEANKYGPLARGERW